MRPVCAGRGHVAAAPQVQAAESQKQMSPIDYLVSIYTNPELPRAERMAAAVAACPFVHPHLAAHMVHNNRSSRTITTVNILAVPSGSLLDPAAAVEAARCVPQSDEEPPADAQRESLWRDKEVDEITIEHDTIVR